MFGLTVQDLVDQVVDDVAIVAGKPGDEAGDDRRGPGSRARPVAGRRSSLPSAPPAPRHPAPSDSSSITSLRYAAASSGVKRRSAARISTSSPRPRSEPSGNAGSARVVITRCSCGGRCSRGTPSRPGCRSRRRRGSRRAPARCRAAAALRSLSKRGKDRCRSAVVGATPAARAQSRRPRAPPSAARRSRRARRTRPGCRLGRARATPRSPVGGWIVEPLGHQRRLAEAGGRGDQGQLRLAPAAQALSQSRTCHQTASQPGDVELGLEQRACVVLGCHADDPVSPRDFSEGLKW